MSTSDRVRFSGASLTPLVLVALRCDLVVALILRSSDGVERVVNASAAVGHSPVLGHLVINDSTGDLDDHATVRVHGVASPELDLLVDFIKTVAVQDVDVGAVRWVQARLHAADLDAQCRLLIAADYLDINLLMVAIVSVRRTWGDIIAMRNALPADVHRFVAENALGLVLLRNMARTRAQERVVDNIQDLLINGNSSAAIVSNETWDASANLLIWAVRNGDELVVEFLLGAPGVDVNARDDDLWTPLHWAAFSGHLHIVKLLMASPTIDINAKDSSDRTAWDWAHANAYREVKFLLEHVDLTLADQAATTHSRVVADMISDLGDNCCVPVNELNQHELALFAEFMEAVPGGDEGKAVQWAQDELKDKGKSDNTTC
ncbi:SKP1 component POZ domain-containing protein [Plasmodiophora brassicae]